MMYLNIPVLEQLTRAKSVLIAGMGGGFDVFCGLPIYFELERLGCDVHLANLSFSDVTTFSDGEGLTDTLVGVTADSEEIFDYFPEYYLSQWFYNERNDDITIWCFEKTGARPLIKNYVTLVKHLGIDAILLIDGGVDSLMHGDEPEPGTILEDSLSLMAVSELNNVPTRLMACVGLGIEPEVGYAHLFENIAALTKSGAFLGSCSLLKDMDAYKQFENAVLYTFDQQPDYASVICSSLISAVRGEYGNHHLTKRTHGSQLRISPLMPIYWFFDAQKVAERNRLLEHLRLTWTIDEAWTAMQKARAGMVMRPTPEHPLS
jgi:hypothetical protein